MDLALAIEEAKGINARYRLNKSIPPDQVILEWRGPGDEPTQQELDGAWQTFSDRIAAEETAAATLKANIKAIAQSAVGLALNELTAAQSRALLAVLLWKGGAIADDMTVKPLKDWD